MRKAGVSHNPIVAIRARFPTKEPNSLKILLALWERAASFRPSFPKYHMSQHRSLKGSSTIAAKRNVLKRFERVEVLKRRNQWQEGDRVIGLRKTKPDA